MNTEQWKDIPEWSGYQVSNCGSVRSYRKGGKLGAYLTKTPKLKTIGISVWGYPEVRLWLNQDTKKFRIHRLVASVFIPNPSNLPEVNHKNGNKLDNSVSNLEWVSRSKNMTHLYQELKSPTMRGEKNGHARLSSSQVRKIKEKWLTGQFRQQDIANQYAVSRTTINAIVNGYNWKHLPVRTT